MKLKDYIAESFKKEYSYRIKIAADCGSQHLDIIEKCLAKYNIESVAEFKRKPIQANPIEFERLKGSRITSEVCSTDVVLKYPVNHRILEVWIAVNLGIDHERVICYGVNDPRRLESEIAEERAEENIDRQEDMEEAVLLDDEQAHYEAEQGDLDVDEYGFGEAYNEKFLKALEEIKAEKGADYFRNYPTKDELMGDNLRPTYDDIMNGVNMGKGQEESKSVDVVFQSGGKA